MEPGEKIAALLAVREWPEQDDQQFIVMGTRRGSSRRPTCAPTRTRAPAASSPWAWRMTTAVIAVQNTDGSHEVLIGRVEGQAIRFRETDVRPMGRTAYGVKGIELRENDEVVAMETVEARRPGADGDRQRLRQAHRPG